MKKLSVVISSPLFTISGYGKHSMDIVKSIIKLYGDVWDIKLFSTKWGNCTMIEDVEEDLSKRVLLSPLKEQPDIWIQITIPNEFQRVGKYNIGITAGIESTLCSSKWIEGMNKMDYVLVPSFHSKHVFDTTIYDKKDQNGIDLGKFQVTVPIDILFEGVDTNVFHLVNLKEVKDNNIYKQLDKQIKEDFCFLITSQWGTGELFHDRKDVGGAVFSFFKAFKNKQKKPALILKCNGASLSETDKERMINNINIIKHSAEFENDSLPNIYLLYGHFSDEEMNLIYNYPKIKALFSLTKGEGYSRTFPEFAVTGKPIITTNFSGHLDFLNEKNSVLIPGELKNIHKSVVWTDILIPESKWLYVNYDTTAIYLKDLVNEYDSYLKKAAKLQDNVINNLSLVKMQEKLKELLDKFIDKNYIQPIEYVDIVLPNLDDIKEL